MRALALLSGGLDSSLAIRLVLDQGVEVIAVKFTSPFCRCDSGGICHAAEIAKEMKIDLITVPKGEDYLELVRSPRFGYGSAMNPCIDCRIYMLRKAKEIALSLGLKFIFTGEVVGQRPMSQRIDTLKLIEKEAGLEGKLLRPLSAKLLQPTEAEQEGWVDRKKFLDISGRSRKRQLELADENNIVNYACPAGGCLLTSKDYSAKLIDFFKYSTDKFTIKDALFLQIGRHFRIDGKKLVIGRNEEENHRIQSFIDENHCILEPINVKGPIGILELADERTSFLAGSFVARYSDHCNSEVQVRINNKNNERILILPPANDELISKYRISETILGKS